MKTSVERSVQDVRGFLCYASRKDAFTDSSLQKFITKRTTFTAIRKHNLTMWLVHDNQKKKGRSKRDAGALWLLWVASAQKKGLALQLRSQYLTLKERI